jgi:anti-sigma B factor antagonist
MIGDRGEPPADEQLLTVHVRQSAGAYVVTANGVVDMMTAPRLRDALLDCLGRARKAIIVDLTAVTMFGSHGLSVLTLVKDQARDFDEPVQFQMQVRRRPRTAA